MECAPRLLRAPVSLLKGDLVPGQVCQVGGAQAQWLVQLSLRWPLSTYIRSFMLAQLILEWGLLVHSLGEETGFPRGHTLVRGQSRDPGHPSSPAPTLGYAQQRGALGESGFCRMGLLAK